MKKDRRRLRLKTETIAELTQTQLKQAKAGYFCTDSCDTCWSLFLTCQGGTCTTP